MTSRQTTEIIDRYKNTKQEATIVDNVLPWNDTVILFAIFLFNAVLNDPTHIACSAETRSELVLPVFDKSAQMIGGLDIDSNMKDAFDEDDVSDLELLLIQVFGSKG